MILLKVGKDFSSNLFYGELEEKTFFPCFLLNQNLFTIRLYYCGVYAAYTPQV